jgi:NAD(P)H-dependent FMN reductase
MSLHIVLVLGSVRPGRMVERLAKLVTGQLGSLGVTPIVLDPLKISGELMTQPLHFLPSPDEAPKWMHEVHQKIIKADGFIVLSSEYNCGIPPAIPNLLNSFPLPSYRHKPCGLITYSMGTFGGVRALTVLKPYVNELGMLPVPCYCPIPNVHSLIDETGVTKDPMVLDRMKQTIQEVLWYAEGLKKHRKANPPPT